MENENILAEAVKVEKGEEVSLRQNNFLYFVRVALQLFSGVLFNCCPRKHTITVTYYPEKYSGTDHVF